MTPATILVESYAAHSPASVARLVEQADAAEGAATLASIDAKLAASVVAAMAPAAAANLLGALPAKQAADIAARLEVLLAATLLRRCKPSVRAAIVNGLERRVRAHLQRLLASPPGTAGALATPHPVALKATHTVADARAAIALAKSPVGEAIYVVDDAGALVGAVTLAALIESADQAPLRKLAQRVVTPLPATADAEEVAEHPGWRDHLTLPVVDHQGTLLGTVRHADLSQRNGETGLPALAAARTGRALAELYGVGVSGLFEWAAEGARGDKRAPGRTK